MLMQQEWDAFNKERISENQIGKFVLCEARENNTTRLFIHQFSKGMSVITKEGWWDTFTIGTKPCAKGFYICKINEFRIDRNGFLNMIVYPGKPLGETVDENAIGWAYLFQNGEFSTEYRCENAYLRFNTTNLNRVFKKHYEDSGYPTMQSFIMSSFMLGDITLDEISSALEEKYDIEKFAEELNKNLEKYRAEYPLFVGKLPTKDFMGYKIHTTQSTINFLEDKSFEYERLKLGTEKVILKQVETVLKHWDDIHNAQKEAKKAKKKLAKMSKSA